MIRSDDLPRLIKLLHLKKVLRSGWTRHPIPPEAVESVADHSFGLALLALLLCPAELDRARAVELALVHDLAEVVTGDITPHDGVEESLKQAGEQTALRELLEGVEGAERYLSLLKDYQRGSSPEARWVKALDKLEMTLQSFIYEDDFDLDLEEFRLSAAGALERLGVGWLSRGRNDPA